MATLQTQQARIQDDLRGLIAGDVRCDEVIRQLYAGDASLFHHRPAGVVWPRSTEDVAATVRYGAENGIPLHPRGSGTTTSGGSLGPGIVLDFTRYMRRILKVDGNRIDVQPGAIRERFNDILHRSGNLFFAPTAGFLPTDTLGGIVSIDAAGPYWLRYATPSQYLLGLEVVTADGSILELDETILPTKGREENDPQNRDAPSTEKSPTERDQTTGGATVEQNAGENSDLKSVPSWEKSPLPELRKILANCPVGGTFGSPDRAGYELDGVLEKTADGKTIFRPARLFAGAEGSLGIMTKLRIAASVRPQAVGGVVLLFDSLEAAARSVEIILDYHPTLCELFDRRTINIVCQQDRRFARFLPPEAESALAVGLTGDSPEEIHHRIAGLVQRIRYDERSGFGSWSATNDVDKAVFRDLLRRLELALLGMRGTFRTITLMEDVRVPVPALRDFLASLQNILKRQNITYSLSGHLGQGQIRILPILPIDNAEIDNVLRPAADEIFELLLRHGGTVVSARGAGLARIGFLPRLLPDRYPVFEKIKRLFDPAGIMNPGRGVFLPRDVQWFPSAEPSVKPWVGTFRNLPSFRGDASAARSSEEEFPELDETIFGSRISGRILPSSNLSPPPKPSPSVEEKTVSTKSEPRVDPALHQLEVQLKWEPSRIADDVFRCTGCGLCRSRTPARRLCPEFRHSPDEQDSCRAKANVLRGILDGELPLETLTGGELRTMADFCVNCHACDTECPTGADIPRLVFRLRSALTAAHGIDLPDRFLSNSDRILRIASLLSCSANGFLNGRLTRWFFEKTFGVPQGRKFPKIERVSFLSRIAWGKRFARPEAKNRRKVALFVDTFSNYFDIRLAEAALKVLRHNGFDVYVPTRQKSSGHQAFSLGNQDRAEALVTSNVRLLADLVRQGYEVVTIEPISAVCISREYLWVADDPDTRLVASKTTDLVTFLYRLYQEGKLATDFSPIPTSVGYHAPCRSLPLSGRPISVATPAEELLRLIPELDVHRLERGCCGLGGPAGLKKSNYAIGLRLGMPLFLALREPNLAFGSTECNFCRLQMEQGTGKSVIHPVKLLACSYGLLPEPAYHPGDRPWRVKKDASKS